MPSPGKWVKGLKPDTPVGEAARLMLRSRLSPLPGLLRLATQHPGATKDAAVAVHQLRVATRRAESTVRVLRALLPAKASRRARKRLRQIRRAAGAVRDLDVQIARFETEIRRASGDRTAALRYVLHRLRAERADAAALFAEVVDRHPPKRLHRLWSDLLERTGAARKPLPTGPSADTPLCEAVPVVLGDRIDAAARAAERDLGDPENLHALRVELKRLRYATELFGACLASPFRTELYPRLVELQDHLGVVNDAWTAAAALNARLEPLRGVKGDVPTGRRAAAPASRVRRGLTSIIRDHERASRAAHASLLDEWQTLTSGLFDSLRRQIHGAEAPATPRAPAPLPIPPAAEFEPKPRRAQPAPGGVSEPLATRNGHAARTRDPISSPDHARRLAAIDIGTNSIRCIVAEVTGEGSYRVIDDEKEVARLGRGLHATGRMDPASIEHALVAIERMKSIAEGLGAGELRAIATAACREAENGPEFLEAVRRRTGLRIEVIDQNTEAQLAYRSAAHAFDLRTAPAAVIDIGGGSAQVTLSAAAADADPARGGRPAGDTGPGGGVVERVYTIPLGAVRLTEWFGGPESSSGHRFEDMRRAIRRTVREHIGKPPITPHLVVGTGGTLTTLGEMGLRRSMDSPADGGLFGGAVQGFELARADLRHLLDVLRKLPIRERSRLPGLPADRADIIVAGLALADGILKRLGANSLRIHEGGIRDGLLLSMVDARRSARVAAGGVAPDPLRGVRRFAQACRYEQRHAEHVASLALQIFDQAAGHLSAAGSRGDATGLTARHRTLLEAAAVLHDTGYLINYASHHKHSYHLIVHADLPGLTPAEVQVVAHVARYHRCAQPKRGHSTFAALPDADRALVRALAAILRIADGLDRTHLQLVQAVRVRAERGAAFFEVSAAEEPSVDIWGGARKADLFHRVSGLLPHFEWRRDRAAPRQVAQPVPVSAAASARRRADS